MSDTGPSRKVRSIVHARSQGRCEFANCGAAATEIHHRYERGMGGFGPKSPAASWINQPANLLHSCAHHNQWCSNHEPREAYLIGWIIKEANGEPELPWTVPVVTAHHPMPVYLSNVDGQWSCFEDCLPESDPQQAMRELVVPAEELGLYDDEPEGKVIGAFEAGEKGLTSPPQEVA